MQKTQLNVAVLVCGLTVPFHCVRSVEFNGG